MVLHGVSSTSCASGRRGCDPSGRPGSRRRPAGARPWCSSRTGRRRPPARRSAARRGRSTSSAGVWLSCASSAVTVTTSPAPSTASWPGLERAAIGTDRAVAGEGVDERVVGRDPTGAGAAAPGETVACSDGDRGVGDAGSGVAGHLAGDDPEQGAAVVGGQQGDLAAADVLVAGRRSSSAGRAGSPTAGRRGRCRPWRRRPRAGPRCGGCRRRRSSTGCRRRRCTPPPPLESSWRNTPSRR